MNAENSPSDSPLVIHDMTVAYGRKPVLWNIDYVSPSRKLIAIVGPNGAGKSTLLKAALGLIPRQNGEALFLASLIRRFDKKWPMFRSDPVLTGISRSVPSKWRPWVVMGA